MYIIANWKSNKNAAEARAWGKQFRLLQPTAPRAQVILCPPTPLLPTVREAVPDFVKLGAQDVSGEEAAASLVGLCDYVLLGHSERRAVGDSVADINQKLDQTVQVGLHPILCFSDLTQLTGVEGDLILAYEPLENISKPGQFNPADPAQVAAIVSEVKQQFPHLPILYGGSVTVSNAAQFTALEGIDGVLVGQSSLDAQKFVKIIATNEKG